MNELKTERTAKKAQKKKNKMQNMNKRSRTGEEQ